MPQMKWRVGEGACGQAVMKLGREEENSFSDSDSSTDDDKLNEASDSSEESRFSQNDNSDESAVKSTHEEIKLSNEDSSEESRFSKNDNSDESAVQ